MYIHEYVFVLYVCLCLDYVYVWAYMSTEVCMQYSACVCVSLPTVSHLWLQLENNPVQEFPHQLSVVASLPESLCLCWKRRGEQERLNTELSFLFCSSVEQMNPKKTQRQSQFTSSVCLQISRFCEETLYESKNQQESFTKCSAKTL